MALGEGDYRYELVDGWPKVPEGWELMAVSDAAVDSQGRIYAFSRGKHPLAVFSKDGDFITSWGYGEFGVSPNLVSQSHGIFITPDDQVYLTDAYQHIVRRYSRLGEKDREWGVPGVPGVTYYRRQFNMPTGVTFSPDGSFMFVSDGYGNRCIHKYTSDGEYITSWGEGGDGPGQFAVVHNIGCDQQGRLLVCDRENNRIQLFDQEGTFIEQWTGVSSPGDVAFTDDGMLYVVEQGTGGHVSVWTQDGECISRFSGSEGGIVQAPHGLAVDDEGSIYVAEIGEGDRGQRLLKFARV